MANMDVIEELCKGHDIFVTETFNGISRDIKGLSKRSGMADVLADLEQAKMRLTAELIRRECCPGCHRVIPAKRVWTQGEDSLLVMHCRWCKIVLHMHEAE